MELYFLRHGIAEDSSGQMKDDERSLTEEGMEKMKKAGYQNIKVTFKDFLLPGMPTLLVKPLIVLGNVAEKIPVVKMMSQSIIIEGEK